MKLKHGTVEIEPSEDAKSLTITLKAKEALSLETTIDFLRCLIQEMHKHIEKKKQEKEMH